MARSKPSDATAPGGKAGRGPKDAGRGRSSGSTASGMASKLDKKGQPKVGRVTKLRNQAGMIKQAYSLTRKNDPKLPWIMLITFVVVAAVVELIGILLSSPYVFIVFAVVTHVLLFVMFKFFVSIERGRTNAPLTEISSRPGSYSWACETGRAASTATVASE